STDKGANSEPVQSTLVQVDTSAPTAPSLAFSALSNASASGSTVFYRPGAAGGFTVTPSSSDPESGVASYSYPSLGSGWSNSGGVYSFSAAAVDPAEPNNISDTNSAGPTSGPTSFTVSRDASAPTTTLNSNGR